MRMGAVVFVSALTMTGRVVSAQEVAVDGGLIYSFQEAPNVDTYHFSQGLGGSAVGVSIGLSRRIASAFDISAEASIPSRFESMEIFSHIGSDSVRYENNHRDIVVSVLIVAHPQHRRRITPEFMLGMSFVREDTLQKTAIAHSSLNPVSGAYVLSAFSAYGPEIAITRETFALTTGGNVELSISEHLAVLPTLRVHWIGRQAFASASLSSLLLNSLVVRPGVSARLRF